MKTTILSTLCYISILLIHVSCQTIDPIDELSIGDGLICSEVVYARNTLDYAVLVQGFYRYSNEDTIWCDSLLAYSEPVLLKPNERKQFMDFVAPDLIKVFRALDSTLLTGEYGMVNGKKVIDYSSSPIATSLKDEQEIGEKPESKYYYLPEEYRIIKADKYLMERCALEKISYWHQL